MSNSDTAIREIAEAEYPDMPGISERAPYNQIMATNRTNLIARLTALISEHYTANEEVDKMVSERLREELIKYSMYASEQWCDTSDRELSEKNIDKYLKSREQ